MFIILILSDWLYLTTSLRDLVLPVYLLSSHVTIQSPSQYSSIYFVDGIAPVRMVLEKYFSQLFGGKPKGD